jgi:cathepsin L
MKALLLLGVVCLGVVSGAALTESQYEFLFTKFVTQFNKQYRAEDFFTRYRIFKDNFDFVQAHNQLGKSYTLAINQFGDLKATETPKGLGHTPTGGRTTPNPELEGIVPLASIDWLAAGAVTPVKDQGQCGSCWSFSATGMMEGAWAVKHKSLLSLSEQQLVDCSGAYGNEGCNGGWPDAAVKYVIANKGIASESSYPYVSGDGSYHTCTASSRTPSGATFTNVVDVQKGNETAILTATNIGPVSICIEADTSTFQFYSGGIMNDPACGTTLDHAVLVTGYGTSGTTNYWSVKNSWGTGWGENGYVRFIRDKNQCGITDYPAYAVSA